jgi:hypothetical protein
VRTVRKNENGAACMVAKEETIASTTNVYHVMEVVETKRKP